MKTHRGWISRHMGAGPAANLIRFGALLGLLSLTGSCASAPAGYTLELRFVAPLVPEAAEQIRVSFRPQGTDAFERVEATSYEDGAVEVEVSSDGVLVIRIDAAHASEASRAGSNGVDRVYDLMMWSDDPAMGRVPRVVVSAIRGGETIGQAEPFFLDGWPPPLGASRDVALTCTREAQADGRCTP